VAKILGGKAVAAEVRSEVAADVAGLKDRGVPVRLDVVLVGDDPASATYVRMKQKDCEEVGIESRAHRFEADTPQRELAALVELSRSLNEALASRQVGQVVSPAARGRLLLPVPTARMSSSFGPRVHPIFGTTRLHAGMDLAAPTGTPISAAAPGAVVTAGWLGGYGNAVVVDHGGGLSTLYAHQSALAVTVGQAVGAGDVVGRVGSTGNSTGPHLHFEVRVLGTPVDPANYL